MNTAKRYAVPIVLGAIAAALMVVGILALTIWKPAQEVVASHDSNQPFSMSRAGVFPLYAKEVNIRATGESDQTVWMALGTPEDVAAWLQDEPYEEIVGLVGNLQTLKAIEHNVEQAQSRDTTEDPQSAEAVVEESQSGAQPAENPIYSDMWTHVKYGRGSVSMDLRGDEMDMSVLIASDGVGPAPTLTLTWKTPQSNILALAAIIGAVVLALIALTVAFILWNTRKKRLSRSVHLRGTEERALSETTAIDMTLGVEELPKRSSKPKKKRLFERAATKDEDSASKDVAVDEAADGEDVPVQAATDAALKSEIADDASAQTEDATEQPSKSHDVEGDSAKDEVSDKSEDAEETHLAKAQLGRPEEDFAPEAVTDLPESEVDEPEPEGDAAEEEETSEQPEDDAGTTEGEDEEATPTSKSRPEPVLEPSRERTETVTTDSGMMNLSALQGGGAFPTRKALRDARRRGVNSLVVGNRTFQTSGAKSNAQDAAEMLRERAIGNATWSEAMGDQD